MDAIQVISLTLLSVLAANAQVIMPGRCPKPAVQENFDAARVNANLFFKTLKYSVFNIYFLSFHFQELTN